MTLEQQNLLDSLKNESEISYDKLDNSQVDYDTFKQVADSSALMTSQAKKVYDTLYDSFIEYPFFIKSLENIYNNKKDISDKDAQVLKQKLFILNSYKNEYDSILAKIKELQVQIDIQGLANKLQILASDPISLTYSYELVDVADQEARKKAEVELVKDTQSGNVVCIDKLGNQVDMFICRPSSSSGSASGVASVYKPTPEQVAQKKLDDWILIVETASKTDDLKEIENAAGDKAAYEMAIAQKQTLESILNDKQEELIDEKNTSENIEKSQEEVLIAEQAAAAKAAKEEAIYNQYSFKVDLTKIEQDKKLADKTAPSPRQQNINYALCNSIKVSRFVTIGDVNLYMYLHSGLIGQTIAYSTSVINRNDLLPIGKKVRFNKFGKTVLEGVVVDYNQNGLLYVKITDVFDIGTYNGFSLQTEYSYKFVINNPFSSYSNGMDLETYISNLKITPEEIAIARAYCPTSPVASEFYKSNTSQFLGFDSSNSTKNGLDINKVLIALSAISIVYIVHNIIKKR